MLKTIFMLLTLSLCNPACAEFWRWTYNSYERPDTAGGGGGITGVGELQLHHRMGMFFIKIYSPFSSGGGDICNKGELIANILNDKGDLVIDYQNELGGCEKFRLVLKKDGSGGDIEFLVDGKWTLFQKNQPRGLKTRSTEELTTLYKLLESLNKVTISDTKATSDTVSQAPVKDKIVDTDSVKGKAEKDRQDAERLAKIQAEVALSRQQLALANQALLETNKKADELARVKAELEKLKQSSSNIQAIPVTSNPLDQVKRTSENEVWISFNPSITVQERQFCRIVENFRTENALAVQSNNKIKVNETYRGFTQSLNSLLPDGRFQGWVMRMVAVDQAADGSAEVLLELPCNIYVGSNACDVNPKNYYGTASEGSRMYTELAKMNVGDFALTSGQFVYTDDKAFDKNRSVASFRFMRTGAHCKAKKISTDSEFFGTKLDVISTIK